MSELLKSYKGNEKKATPDKVKRFTLTSRIDMLNDLRLRKLSGGKKLRWLLVLLLWPFGTSAYYYNVYNKAPSNSVEKDLDKQVASTSLKLNRLLFLATLMFLIILVVAAIIFWVSFY